MATIITVEPDREWSPISDHFKGTQHLKEELKENGLSFDDFAKKLCNIKVEDDGTQVTFSCVKEEHCEECELMSLIVLPKDKRGMNNKPTPVKGNKFVLDTKVVAKHATIYFCACK